MKVMKVMKSVKPVKATGKAIDDETDSDDMALKRLVKKQPIMRKDDDLESGEDRYWWNYWIMELGMHREGTIQTRHLV